MSHMRQFNRLIPSWRPITICSGGQTGVDRAALDAALDAEVPISGWLPADGCAEDGLVSPHYRKHMKCLPKGGYDQRTRANVRDADITLIIYKETLTGGTLLTSEYAQNINKPLILINAEEHEVKTAVLYTLSKISQHDLQIINAAGPRASQWDQGYDYAYRFFTKLLSKIAPSAN